MARVLISLGVWKLLYFWPSFTSKKSLIKTPAGQFEHVNIPSDRYSGIPILKDDYVLYLVLVFHNNNLDI